MPPVGPERTALAIELSSASNSGGGWSYYPGKASRLEPTCWALLALNGNRMPSVGSDGAHREFLMRCQRADGWLVEDSNWPVNIAFNALVAFVCLNRPELVPADRVQRLLSALISTKGVQVPSSPAFAQNNSLQGWSWNPETFSWVEPTAWGAVALRKAVGTGLVSDAMARSRIDEADRLLFDRCCHNGGWNFGNANVMGQDLYPHVPTTAVALLALQNRRDQDAVTRSLAFLESHWAEEQSLLALGLSMICFTVYGRPVNEIRNRLRDRVAAQQIVNQGSGTAPHSTATTGSLHGRAVALAALSLEDNDRAFRT